MDLETLNEVHRVASMRCANRFNFPTPLEPRPFFRSSSEPIAVPLNGAMPHLTRILASILLASTAFAFRMWHRPFDFSPDPAAHFIRNRAALRRDRWFNWLGSHLQREGKIPRNMTKPIRQKASSGRVIEPTDSILVRSCEARDCDGIGLKFRLNGPDLTGTLGLQINDGTLLVKSNPGVAETPGETTRTLTTNRW